MGAGSTPRYRGEVETAKAIAGRRGEERGRRGKAGASEQLKVILLKIIRLKTMVVLCCSNNYQINNINPTQKMV